MGSLSLQVLRQQHKSLLLYKWTKIKITLQKNNVKLSDINIYAECIYANFHLTYGICKKPQEAPAQR